MTENAAENQAVGKPSDEAIMARAKEIQAESGVGLVDAMIEAEAELTPQPATGIPDSFTVTIPLKPRVARWVMHVFGGHAELTIEDRLGAYLAQTLNRVRIKEIRDNEPPPEVDKGTGAVSLRREQMAKLEK